MKEKKVMPIVCFGLKDQKCGKRGHSEMEGLLYLSMLMLSS